MTAAPAGTGRPAALVTGSRKGIGFACARLLAENGYRVIFSGSTPEDQLGAVRDEIAGLPNHCRYLACDISRPEDRTRIFQEILSREGRLDVLVNNAGVAPLVRQDLLETSEESFDRVLGINLSGTFFMCQEAARHMLARKETMPAGYAPRIINISSVSAYASSTNRAEYCISKAGISMVTALFAHRLAGAGIPVFEIRPGIIDTDMTAGVHDKYQQMIRGGLLPIRRFGRPEDVARMVLAACSGLLDYTTGQVLHADGGYHLRRL